MRISVYRHEERFGIPFSSIRLENPDSNLPIKPGSEYLQRFYAIVAFNPMRLSNQKFFRPMMLLLAMFSMLILALVAFSLGQCLSGVFILPIAGSASACDYPRLDYTPFDFIPLLVGLGYWVAGWISWRERQASSTTAFFLLGTLTLAAGLLSGANILPYMGNLFYISLTILTPLILYFHLAFLKRPFRRFEKILIALFGGVCILLLPPLFFLPYDSSALKIVLLLSRLVFMAAALWTCIVLITSYNHFTSLSSRRQIRMIAFGSLFAFAPLVLLSVLPLTLHIENVDFNGTFPGLLIIPIVYGYVTFRNRLRLTEKRFRQLWVYYLLFTTLLCVYLLLLGLLHAAFGQQIWVYTGGTAGILIIILFLPLRNLLNRFVMWIFYGSETDYSQAIQFLGEKLAGVIEREKLQSILLDELVAAVHPSQAVLYLRQANHSLAWAGTNGMDAPLEFQSSFSGHGALAQFLIQRAGPLDTWRVQKATRDQPLSPAESSILAIPGVALWLPMVGEDRLHGLLLFGFRAGDDRFTEEDQRLLGSITHQAGAAIRNVIMAEDLRAGQEELALANQKLILRQEQEQRRLARELHDDTVQQLLGLSFRLTGMRKRASKIPLQSLTMPNLVEDLELVRRDLLDVVSQLRGMIGELRPAGLDELGLTVALEGYVDQLRGNYASGAQAAFPKVNLDIDEDISFLSEMQSICIFRIAQEALRNACQHAQPTQIDLQLKQSDHQLHLTIQDNGCGFNLPERLSEFTQENHYGLVGMWERVRAAGGELTIITAPEKGTHLKVVLPLEEPVHE